MTSFRVKVLQKKFTLLHAHFSKIVLKYSNEVHLLRYLTPLVVTRNLLSKRLDHVAQLVEHWASIPKVAGSIPTVVRQTFHSLPGDASVMSVISGHVTEIDFFYVSFYRSLLDFIKKLNFFNNLTNQTISFDSNGNPRVTRFTVVKLEVGNGTYNDTIIGNWTCREKNETASCEGRLSNSILEVVNPTSFNSSCGPTCTPGWYKSVKEDHPDCCWTCKRCTGNKFTNTSGQFSCDQCDDSKWPDSNHTSCAEIEHEYLDIRSAPGVLILAWNGLGVAVVLFVGGVFLKYSSSHIVKASSRQLSLLLLVGISVDFAILIALLREPNVSQCTAIFVFGHAANCLVAGTLLLKTNRIHRIFRKSAMTGVYFVLNITMPFLRIFHW